VVWEPVREVALEAVQVRSGGAVADVAVGSGKVVRRLLHTQPREHLPADVCRALGAASRVVLYGGSARTAVSWPVSSGVRAAAEQ
jgi:hypothetical protein